MEIKEIMNIQAELDSLTIDNAATGQNIKALCRGNGIRFADLAEMLGLTGPQTMYNWMEGKSKPSLDNIIKISRVLNVGVDDLVKLSNKAAVGSCQ